MTHFKRLFQMRNVPPNERKKQPRVRGHPFPYECGPARCVACGASLQLVTQFPTIRKEIPCPHCGANSLFALETLCE